jgi:hypothetical protein
MPDLAAFVADQWLDGRRYLRPLSAIKRTSLGSAWPFLMISCIVLLML